MKKIVVWLLVIGLLLGAGSAWAEEGKGEYRFLDIEWGSDMMTVCKAMKDAGLINEEGEARFEQTLKFMEKMHRYSGRYEHFDQEDGAWVITDDGCPNVESVHIMSDMIAQEWMGLGVHNIGLYFVIEGDTQKLIHVEVDFFAGQDDDDLDQKMKEQYGKPDQEEDEENGEYGYFWIGENNTGMMYYSLSHHFGLLNAKEVAEAAGI